MIFLGGKLIRVAHVSSVEPHPSDPDWTLVLMVDGSWVHVNAPFNEAALAIIEEDHHG